MHNVKIGYGGPGITGTRYTGAVPDPPVMECNGEFKKDFCIYCTEYETCKQEQESEENE